MTGVGRSSDGALGTRSPYTGHGISGASASTAIGGGSRDDAGLPILANGGHGTPSC